jgi:hypothetical protein
VVFVLGVEVGWYLLSSIIIYVSVLIPTSYKAETMPNCEKSNNKYNRLIFLRIELKGRFMLDRASFAWLHKCNDCVERSAFKQ